MTGQDPTSFGPQGPDLEARVTKLEGRAEALEREAIRIDQRVDAHDGHLTDLLKEVQDIRKGLPWATLAVCVVQVIMALINKL